MITEQQKTLRPGNIETATEGQLRAIPTSCSKQGRCGISAAPLKFTTETDILRDVLSP